MLRNCIKNIIEPLGFVDERDGEEERWVALFSSVSTAELVTVVTREQLDETNTNRILFYLHDESGELFSVKTLDQLLMAIETDLTPIPDKSNTKYAAMFNMSVQVPVDMSKVSQMEYLQFMKVISEEIEIPCRIGMEKLREMFEETDIHVLSLEWKGTSVVEK